jgi:alcohol dehydrogenase YqhD (iron-dependent ADH family)
MHVEKTAKEGIRRLKSFFRLIGMPTTLEELGASVDDIPQMVMHRSIKGFPFGGFAQIGPAEMADILCLCEGE